MNEQDLIGLWVRMRTQIIFAQIAPSLVLIAVFVSAAFGKFETASDATKYLALGTTAATGILAIISQYAAVREGEALLADLAQVSKRSSIGMKIGQSRGMLSLTSAAFLAFGFLTFALTVWAVLG
jgi:uncharacterized membrane protein